MSTQARARNQTSFGKYTLLDCIAESIMSEVYRAKLDVGGVTRLVVIKTLHPKYLGDQRSRDLFFREVQTCMTLNHSNIVQVHDFGEIDRRPYIVMEWIHCRNLRQIVSKVIQKTGKGLPPAIACRIVREVAAGLEHAYSLNVIHRDLSPYNVLVSFEGTVKLIDFGIAKVASRDSETLSDNIRGKAAYLSPEQACGRPLDRRSDLFSMGSVFFELLTGRKLFEGGNDLECLEKVKNADVYVSNAIRGTRGIPTPLVPVFLKNQKTDRKLRYGSAAEFAKSLPDFGESPALSQFMKELFQDEFEEDRKALIALVPRARQGLSSESTADDFPAIDLPKSVPRLPVSAAVAASRQFPELTISVPESVPDPAYRIESAEHVGTQNVILDTAHLVKSQPPLDQQLETKPAWYRSRSAMWITVTAGIVAVAGIYGFLDELGEQVPAAVPAAVSPSRIGVRLKLSPQPTPLTEIRFDDDLVRADAEPLIEATAGKKHRLVIRKDGFSPYSRELLFSEDAAGREQVINVELKPLNNGLLSIRITPDCDVRISDGKSTWLKRTPVQMKVPAGTYQVRFAAGSRGDFKDVRVVVREGSRAVVIENGASNGRSAK